jgi:DNA-binding NarL/FixJ family response regulator
MTPLRRGVPPEALQPAPYVYVLEPQTLFVPTLTEIIFAAGGGVASVTNTLDVRGLATLHADYALLDLDYTEFGVADGLALFRTFAPAVRPIVLTEERDVDRLHEYRCSGADAVLEKTMDARAMREALRAVFAVDSHVRSVRAESVGPGSHSRSARTA